MDVCTFEKVKVSDLPQLPRCFLSIISCEEYVFAGPKMFPQNMIHLFVNTTTSVYYVFTVRKRPHEGNVFFEGDQNPNPRARKMSA